MNNFYTFGFVPPVTHIPTQWLAFSIFMYSIVTICLIAFYTTHQVSLQEVILMSKIRLDNF